RTDSAKRERHPRRRRERRLFERRWPRTLGATLRLRRRYGGVFRSPFPPVHRNCVDPALRLGLGPPSLPERGLALHSNLFVWMHDLRRGDRGVVLGGCSVPGRRRISISEVTIIKLDGTYGG